MNKIRLVLALLVLGSGFVSNAQYPDDQQPGVSGSICEVGRYCPPPSDHDGGGQVDPSPYDPQPGRPDFPHHSHYPPVPQYPDYPPAPVPKYPNHGGDRRDIYIGRRLQNEQLDLMRMAGINAYQDRGAVIDSVEIFAQPGAVQAETSLNVDGYIESSQAYPTQHMVLYPNRQLVVGQTFNQMSLGIRGVLYVDHITVNLRDGGYHPPYGDVVVNGYVNQSFYMNVTLDLLRYVNLYNYRGYRIESVTIHGRNLDSRGSARVVVNGIVAGRVNLSYSGDTVQMPINVSVGQNLQSLNLQVVASAEIDGIEINLTQY